MPSSRGSSATCSSSELTFAYRGGRTVLDRSRVEAPTALIRPFALADGRQLVQLNTLGPGLCGGNCTESPNPSARLPSGWHMRMPATVAGEPR